MNDINESINPNKRNPTRKELIEFINSCLDNLKEINNFYRKLNEDSEENKSIIADIEEKYSQIVDTYKDIFHPDEQGIKKIDELNNKINEIKQFHQGLLVGEDSIQADIEDSKKHITDFYNFLFSAENDKGKNNKEQIEEIIASINSFNNDLIKPDGIQQQIDDAHKNILKKYTELFEKELGMEESRIEQLSKNIANIDAFDKKIISEIDPKIKEKNIYLEKLQKDIDKKRSDIDSLLSSVTGGALAEGYRESMQEYSKKNARILKQELKNEKNIFIKAFLFFEILFFNLIGRHISVFFHYSLFIIPLILICIILWNPHFINELLGKPEKLSLTGPDFIIYKTMLTVPLLWIAWFGQKNISSRKRLFEEYNHKLRVAQMYLQFTTNGNTYNLQNRNILENTLLEAIKNNPAEHLGKGETIIDNLLEKFRLEGFYRQLKSEITQDIKSLLIKDEKIKQP